MPLPVFPSEMRKHTGMAALFLFRKNDCRFLRTATDKISFFYFIPSVKTNSKKYRNNTFKIVKPRHTTG